MFQDFTNDQEVKSQRKRSHSRESPSRKIPKSYDGDLSNYHVTDSVLADLETDTSDTDVDVKPLGPKQHTFTWWCLLWP